MGLLAFILDPAKPSSLGATGWRNFLLEVASANPFRHTLHFARIGHMTLPDCATDVLFNQANTPFGSMVAVGVVDCEKGVRPAGGGMVGCACV